MTDANFGSWAVDQSPIAIEYSLVVIEEIRQEVADGFQKLSRGGIEVGGILYGTREGRTIRILAMRAFPCEHARGPGFLLSDHDRQALSARLEADQQDSALEGFVCVGWFVSHTRSEINLTDSDLEVYGDYFSAPWQVTMVVRPGRGGTMRAGFFVRESDGSVNAHQSYQEFNFPDRLAGVLDQVPRQDRRATPERRRSARPERPLAVAPSPTRREVPFPAAANTAANSYDAGPQFLPSPPPRRRWPWLVVWLIAVAALTAFGVRYFTGTVAPQPLSLALVEKGGLLQIEWNRTASPISGASRGSLSIVDGKESQNVALSKSDLAAGRFAYQRKSGDIEVRLTIQSSDGASIQEASRYLGQAPATVSSGEVKALETRRGELETEVKRLQQENGVQAERILQLERTLRILQTRIGAEK